MRKTEVLKNSQQNNSEAITNENDQEIWIDIYLKNIYFKKGIYLWKKGKILLIIWYLI